MVNLIRCGKYGDFVYFLWKTPFNSSIRIVFCTMQELYDLAQANLAVAEAILEDLDREEDERIQAS